MNDLETRVAATARMLLSASREASMFVTGDHRVSEQDAATLIGFTHAGSLKNARSEGRAPPHYRRAGRVTYRLCDIARWIEEGFGAE
jgi:hypothetical protein